MHVQEFASRLGAQVDPTLALEITGVAPMDEAGPSEVTFLANPSYARKLKDSRAAAVLVDPGFVGDVSLPMLKVQNPYLAFAKAIALFHQSPTPDAGVHPTVVLGRDVVLGKGVSVGAYVVLGDRVRVGDGTTIHPHCVIYPDAEIGAHALLHSGVVVREAVKLGRGVILQNGCVVGSDGFGFAPRGDGSWHKIPQSGTVEVGDDVEIQALSCVDRATVGKTTVGRGTKIDNLVQIGHGCRIGEDSILCGQVGLAGTTRLGNRVTLAGQVGTAGHLTIGDGANVAAQSGVVGDVAPGATVGWTPATDMRTVRAMALSLPRLPELIKRVKVLEKLAGVNAAAPPPSAP